MQSRTNKTVLATGLKNLLNIIVAQREPKKRPPINTSGTHNYGIKFTREKKLEVSLENEMKLIGEIFWPKTGMKEEEKKQLVESLIQIILENKITKFDQLEKTITEMIKEAENKALNGNEEAYKQAIALKQFLKNIKKLDYYQRKKLETRMESLEMIRRKYL